MKNPTSSTNSQAVLNQLILDHLMERKRKRIWRWILRGFLMLIALWVFYNAASTHHTEGALRLKPHVGVIDIKGEISDKQMSSAESFSESLKSAYDNHKNMKALVFRIDSPGGSPVQADYMYTAAKYYREKYPEIKTYAVCVDMCASAAYYVAVAADEIYAAQSSMVGSIGVIYNGFGFVDSLHKLGASRRLQTAGAHKAFLDPFSPEKPEDAAYLQRMLDLVHQQFIDVVKIGRGARLKVNEDTFSGLFWTGTQAKAQGLIDGFGSTESLARDVIKVEDVVDYTAKENVMALLSKNLGAEVAHQLPAALGLKPGLR